MLTDFFNFDTKTLLGILVWGNGATGIIIYLYHTFNVKNTDCNKILNMAIIRLLCATGYLLLFLRGNISNIISVNVGNSILLLCHYLEAHLILKLAGVYNKKLNTLITAVFYISICAFNAIELYYKDASLRVSMSSVTIFFIFLLPTIRIITSKEVSKFKRSIGIFYIFLLCALIPRSILSFFDKNIDLFSNNYYQTFMFIAFILLMVSNVIIYLLFIKEKTDIVIGNSNAVKTVLNALDTYLFVTELDTDRIIFINDKMKEQFKLGEDAAEKPCYKVMNSDKNERCDFCVKSKLLKNLELSGTINTQVEINGVKYKKSDSIIEWHDGHKVHLHYYIDISELKNAEIKLETQVAKLERMSALINAAQQSISYIMPDGRFDFFNPATCELSGYTAEELKEEGAYQFYDENTKRYIIDEILPIVEEQGKYEFELPFIRKGGEVRTMKYSAFTINDGINGRGYIISDITELKQLERELMEAKEKAERIINTAPVVYGLSIDGVVIEVNEYAKKHLGMKPGDKTLSYYTNPEERRKFCIQAEIDKSLVSGVVRFHMPDGGSHRFLTNYSGFRLNQKDAVIIWAVDIEFSELQKDQLRLSQESLQRLLDVMPVAVRILDREEETLIYANRAASKMYEAESPELFYGKRIDALMPELQPDGTCSIEKLYGLNMSNELISEEMVFKKVNGEDFDSRISVFPIEYKGRKATVGIIQDLSAEKAYADMLKNTAEKEKEANRLKSEFLSRMSHEIRTPMNAIIGMTLIAKNSKESLKIEQCLDKIDNASRHLLGVINDILDMSKIEADKFELSYSEFSFYEMFENLVNIVRFHSENKQQAISIKIEDTVPAYIISDEQRLSQVIINLLSNAVKFTPKRGTISLNIVKIDENDIECIIQIEVVDNGIGISLEQQSNIFNSFEQAGGKIFQQYGGTGLGLAISKKIIELMGGSIWVESELGSGSRFIFKIKALKGDGKQTKMKQIETLSLNNDFSGFTILMVEDIEINRDIILSILEETGITIDIAVNGLDAVKCLKENKNRYNLVLMDINMPEMNGYDAARTIRSLEHDTARTVPIIAMTADVFQEDIERCLAAGMNDHIGKPIDVNELYKKLNTYLKKRPVDQDKRNNAVY